MTLGAALSLGAIQSEVRTVVISDDVSCPECRIRVTKVTTLGNGSDDGLVCQYWTRVAADSRGRLYVAPSCTAGEIDLYSAAGNLIRSIGRIGQGPAEFAYLQQVYTGPDDYLYVFDTSHQMKVLAPDYQEHSRSIHSMKPPAAFAAGTVAEGAVVATEHRAADGTAYPLHRVAPDGTVAASFGTGRRASEDSRWQDLWQMVTPAGNGLVWTSKSQPDDYIVELWNPATASLEMEIRRDVDWYGQPETAGALVQGLHRDEQGLLWSLLAMSSREWEWGDPARTPEEINRDRFSILEVLDPEGGRLVAQHRVGTVFERFIGHQMMYSFRSLPDGNNVIDVWRFELTTGSEF